MTPELSRTVAVDRLPAGLLVEATGPECLALAGRLHIPEVRSLWCRFTLRRQGAVVTADGVLDADVVQSCVVSLEPVAQRVEERFTVRFVPEGQESGDEDPESPDEIPYAGSVIDLGEAAAEQLALSLDPYPRDPAAELDAAAVEAESGLFGGLAVLRPKH